MRPYKTALLLSASLLMSACGSDTTDVVPETLNGQFSLAVSDSPMAGVSHVGMVMSELVMTDDNLNSAAVKQEAWQAQAARYGLLSEVVLLIAKTPDLQRMLTGAINKIKWVIDFERCTLALLNSDEQTYQLQTLLETPSSLVVLMGSC